MVLISSVVSIIILVFVLIKVREKRNDNEIGDDEEGKGGINKVVFSIALSFFIGSTFFLANGLEICDASQAQAYIEYHFTSKADATAQSRGDEWCGWIWDDSRAIAVKTYTTPGLKEVHFWTRDTAGTIAETDCSITITK